MADSVLPPPPGPEEQFGSYQWNDWYQKVRRAINGASSVNLTSQVTGVLPIANGGTGSSIPGLVAGTYITITGTWPNQTINVTRTGYSGTITTAKLTGGGANGSMTFSNGLLTAQTAAT